MAQVTFSIKVALALIVGVLVGLSIGGSMLSNPTRKLRTGVSRQHTAVAPPLVPATPHKPSVGDCSAMILRGRQVNADIAVYLPNFMNEKLLISNMRLMVHRSSAPHLIQYFVITMEDELPQGLVRRVQTAVPGVTIFHVPQPNVSGGSALPVYFRSVLEHTVAKITVTADTDALVLADGWDDRLREIFTDENMALAAINPRSKKKAKPADNAGTQFTGTAEWNWMAWRTAAFQGDFWRYEGDPLRGAHDWGHIFTLHAQKHGYKQHLWNVAKKFPYKAAIVAGDAKDPLWVLHTFYASRRHKELATNAQHDSLPNEESTYDNLPLDHDLARVVEWCGSHANYVPEKLEGMHGSW